MLKFFAEKNVSSFCSAKATHIFSAKNIRILYIESAKTVNEMTLNKLVKLTTLWTTGPWALNGLSDLRNNELPYGEVCVDILWSPQSTNIICSEDKLNPLYDKKNVQKQLL